MRVDFSGVESKNFDAIPGGWYHVKVTDGEQTETKEAKKLPAGTPGVNWEFTVQDGEYADRKVWTNTWLHENSIWALKGLLEATGRYSAEQLAESLEFEIDDVIGSDVMIRVAIRDYNGDDVNDVKRIKAYTGETSSTGSSSLLP
jgi:hypothetical protein